MLGWDMKQCVCWAQAQADRPAAQKAKGVLTRALESGAWGFLAGLHAYMLHRSCALWLQSQRLLMRIRTTLSVSYACTVHP